MRAELSNSIAGVLNNCIARTRRWLPHACVLCGEHSGETQICTACDADLPRLPRRCCAVCALPLSSGSVCGACLDAPPLYTRVRAAFAYGFPVDALIHAYKYGRRLAHARILGAALAAVAPLDSDVIVPMPLAPGRLGERGFNQALEIARFLAAVTGVALMPRACRKVIDTPPQAALPWKERARNVRRAFVCDADFHGARVAVVDDVMTTGATLNELARVLRKAGAVEVTGWVVARTLPR